jgi:hypothetical protein
VKAAELLSEDSSFNFVDGHCLVSQRVHERQVDEAVL